MGGVTGMVLRCLRRQIKLEEAFDYAGAVILVAAHSSQSVSAVTAVSAIAAMRVGSGLGNSNSTPQDVGIKPRS